MHAIPIVIPDSLIPYLGIVREPSVWDVITSQYPGTHDIGQANHNQPSSDQNNLPYLILVLVRTQYYKTHAFLPF